MSHPPLTAVGDLRRIAGTGGLTVTCVNPLNHAAEIKQLFLAHERPEFSEFFDRVYPEAVAEGAASWVGRDDDGRICGHVALFPRQLVCGRRTIRGSLLANMMVATSYRTFWPALALVRRVVADSKQAGGVDLLYADPNESAGAILQAAGFRSVGALQRSVLPLTDRRRSVALGIRLYHLLGRLRARATPLALTERCAGDAHGAPHRVPVGDARSLLPVRGASLYRGRLAGYPGPSDRWYVFHATGPREVPVGSALVRGPDGHGLAVICALQCEPRSSLSSMLIALGRRLRQTGAARLEVCVMADSQAARAARRAGFLPRRDRVPVVALPLTPLGADVMAAGPEWHLLPIDLDR